MESRSEVFTEKYIYIFRRIIYIIVSEEMCTEREWIDKK